MAGRDEAQRKQVDLIRAFRKTFGPSDENRTPEQKIVWAVLEAKRKSRCIPKVIKGPIDPSAVIHNEGERSWAEHLQTLATTPIVEDNTIVVKKT